MTHRLLLFAPDYKPTRGGIAEFSYRVADELSSLGADITLVAPESDSSDFDAQQHFRTVRSIFPIRTTALGRLRSAAEAASYRGTLRGLADSLGVDYCLSAQVPHPFWAWALTGLGRPCGVVLHGDEVLRFRSARLVKRRSLRRFVLDSPDVFCNSRFTAEAAHRVLGPAVRTTVVGCGISPDALPSAVDRAAAHQELGLQDRSVVLTVGRLVERKGIDTMIRAMPQILARVPDTLYLVAGEGPDRDRLERLAREVGCNDRVRFDGDFDDRLLAHYYGAADLFVMASRQISNQSVEGFGIVYLEAGYYGIAVIGGLSGGTPDAVLDGETGLLVDGSSKQQLAEAVVGLLEDPDRRRALGQAGRKRAIEEMTWSRVASRIYERIGATLRAGAPQPRTGSRGWLPR